MTTIIQLPHVGESVTEGIIGKWLKQVGQRFDKYEPLVEVVTDKVTMEMPAPFAGVLTRILAKEGDTVPMGGPIAEAEAEGVTEVSPERPAAQPPRPEAAPPSATAAPSPQDAARRARIGTFTEGKWGGPTGGQPEEEPQAQGATTLASPAGAPPAAASAHQRHSPVVSRLAQEHQVDLGLVHGTGLGGRVTKQDVLQYLEQRGKQAAAPAAPAVQAGAGEEVVALTALRRAIATNVSRSYQEIPHAWMAMEVDVTNLVRRREALKGEFLQREGVSLTYLPFVIRVVAEALKEHPDANARWGGDGVARSRRIHIGIAVGVPQGLVVPVIHDADHLSVAGLARACHALIQRAQAGKLHLPDVQGGTFTVNNTGVLGSVFSGPLINYPQTAIVTTEAIVKRPVVREDDSIAIRHMMNICLSFDHRALDGLGAGAFLMRIKKGLEAVGADTPVS